MPNAGAAPTGCFKCGRPGHWSRDCPSTGPEANPTSDSANQSSKFDAFRSSGGAPGKDLEKNTEKPKKAPRTRPKLTPETLLSNDGLGYVLRHFPRAFKFRGRGHEVSDLGNLIGMYEEWHSHLLPYYSFEQFVHKVEQVGSSKRVKMALRDLREKVANGGDITKLHEKSGDHEGNHEQEAKDSEDPSHDHEDTSFHNQNDIMQEDILHNIYEKANEVEKEVSHACQSKTTCDTSQYKDNVSSKGIEAEKLQGSNHENRNRKISDGNEMTEEQKARIEANRLKAMEKAAARKAAGHQSVPS